MRNVFEYIKENSSASATDSEIYEMISLLMGAFEDEQRMHYFCRFDCSKPFSESDLNKELDDFLKYDLKSNVNATEIRSVLKDAMEALSAVTISYLRNGGCIA